MSLREYRDLRPPYLNQRRLSHVDCSPCTRAREAMYQKLTGELIFSDAFEVWMSHRTIQSNGLRTNASYLAQKTERDYRVCAKALNVFFGPMRLDRIEVEHLFNYQNLRAVNPPDPDGLWRCLRDERVRSTHETLEAAETWSRLHGGGWEIRQTLWAHRAGANCIRKEIAILIRILKGARLWGSDEVEHFQRLRPVESDVERAMTIQEQHRFLHVAASRPEFRFIYHYAIVALQTTASTNELRALRLGDIYLAHPSFIKVPRQGAKNKFRMRDIPLVTEEARNAMGGLVARAQDLGASNPSHYLFPIQARRGEYDPTRPMSESGLKKPWDAVRRAAGLPELRIYDLRHTGITRMAEANVPLPVAMSFAGHMTARMQRRYTAICMAAKHAWGAQVWGNGAPETADARSAEWPPRRPVASEALPMYQIGQHFNKRA